MGMIGRQSKRLLKYVIAWSVHAATGRQKTTRNQLLRRVRACSNCPHLRTHVQPAYDLCGLCDCYVVDKAAMKEQVCPDIPPRWEDLSQELEAEDLGQ